MVEYLKKLAYVLSIQVWIPAELVYDKVIDSNVENTERQILLTLNFQLYVILGEQYIET